MKKKDCIDTRNQKKWQSNAPTTMEEWKDYKVHGAFITKLSTREIDTLINQAKEYCANIALALDSNRGNEKDIARAIRDSKE